MIISFQPRKKHPALFIHEWLNKDNGPLSETLHPEDRSRIRDYFDHLAGKQPEQVHRASLEYRLRLKEGGFRWFRGPACTRF